MQRCPVHGLPVPAVPCRATGREQVPQPWAIRGRQRSGARNSARFAPFCRAVLPVSRYCRAGRGAIRRI